MLKKINRVLKLVGLNLVHAKRKAPKSEAQRVKEFVEEFCPSKRYTADELVNCPLDAKCNRPLSDYMGETKWQNTPPVAVPVSDENGGDCLLHCHSNASENTAIGYQTIAQVMNPDAAFVPVDIGVNDHEITRTEHESKR